MASEAKELPELFHDINAAVSNLAGKVQAETVSLESAARAAIHRAETAEKRADLLAGEAEQQRADMNRIACALGVSGAYTVETLVEAAKRAKEVEQRSANALQQLELIAKGEHPRYWTLEQGDVLFRCTGETREPRHEWYLNQDGDPQYAWDDELRGEFPIYRRIDAPTKSESRPGEDGSRCSTSHEVGETAEIIASPAPSEAADTYISTRSELPADTDYGNLVSRKRPRLKCVYSPAYCAGKAISEASVDGCALPLDKVQQAIKEGRNLEVVIGPNGVESCEVAPSEAASVSPPPVSAQEEERAKYRAVKDGLCSYAVIQTGPEGDGGTHARGMTKQDADRIAAYLNGESPEHATIREQAAEIERLRADNARQSEQAKADDAWQDSRAMHQLRVIGRELTKLCESLGMQDAGAHGQEWRIEKITAHIAEMETQIQALTKKCDEQAAVIVLHICGEESLEPPRWLHDQLCEALELLGIKQIGNEWAKDEPTSVVSAVLLDQLRAIADLKSGMTQVGNSENMSLDSSMSMVDIGNYFCAALLEARRQLHTLHVAKSLTPEVIDQLSQSLNEEPEDWPESVKPETEQSANIGPQRATPASTAQINAQVKQSAAAVSEVSPPAPAAASEGSKAEMVTATEGKLTIGYPAAPAPAAESGKVAKWSVRQDYSAGPCRIEWETPRENNGSRFGATADQAFAAADWLNRRTEIEAQLAQLKQQAEAWEIVKKHRLFIAPPYRGRSRWEAWVFAGPTSGFTDDPVAAVLALAAQLESTQKGATE